MRKPKLTHLLKDGLRATRRAARAIGAAARRAGADGVPQSGALPYRVRGGRVEVLLVTSRRRGTWIVPKGNLEPGMSAADSAAKEAMEEGGVVGHVRQSAAGAFRYRKGGILYSVTVYDLEVDRELADWPERGQRQRAWLGVKAAAGRLRPKSLRETVLQLPARLKESTPTDSGEREGRNGSSRRRGR